MTKKVIFCIPTITKPHPACVASLEAAIPVIKAAGWDEGTVYEIGCPYISHARSKMLRKALDAQADAVVFIDHDISFRPCDLLALIEAEGDVVAGTYRFKRDPVEYMGASINGPSGKPMCRDTDHAVMMSAIPAGFLKITKNGVNRFMIEYPELCYGDRFALSIDLFNHGAHNHIWYGEDYAFARRWIEKCGDIWCLPDMQINHHAGENEYAGNYHEYLLSLGAKA